MKTLIVVRLLLLAAAADLAADEAKVERAKSLEQQTAAVDIRGRRHYGGEYSIHSVPWIFGDRLRWFAPLYPYEDRSLHHEGAGLFRLTIDVTSGRVTKVRVMKSTRFPSLDAAAINSFLRWRWKRQTWSEIDLPITFKMSEGPPRLGPDATALPPPN